MSFSVAVINADQKQPGEERIYLAYISKERQDRNLEAETEAVAMEESNLLVAPRGYSHNGFSVEIWLS